MERFSLPIIFTLIPIALTALIFRFTPPPPPAGIPVAQVPTEEPRPDPFLKVAPVRTAKRIKRPLSVSRKKTRPTHPSRSIAEFPLGEERGLPLRPEGEKKFRQRSEIKVAGGIEYFRVDALDRQSHGKAIIISDASPRFTLSWALQWTEGWSTEFAFSQRQEKIAVSSSSAAVLKKTEYTRTSTSVALNRHWSKKNRTQLFAARSARGFLRSNAAAEISFDSAYSTDLGLKHEITLLKVNKASAGIEFMAAKLGRARNADLTTEKGSQYRASLIVRHQMKKMSLEGRAFYEASSQDTPDVKQRTKEVGSMLSLNWEFP